MLMIRLPSNGARIAGSVVEAFHNPRSLLAFSREGKASIESAQSTLVYAPYPRPNTMPSGHIQAARLSGKTTNARAAAHIQSVAKQTTGARLLMRSDTIPETTPLTTAP